MNIVFRVDASTEIGTGHVMRCLTLADYLTKQSTITFVCREHPGHLCAYIESRGHQVIRLPVIDELHEHKMCNMGKLRHSHWLKASQQLDASQTIKRIKHEQVDLLIIDHYGIDAEWERELSSYAGSIMVIDDLADRYHDCDLLLDQNFHNHLKGRYAFLVPSDCKQFLGPRYALLRKEFQDIKSCLRDRDGQVRRILVFFGGVDSTNETMKTMNAIRRLHRSDIVTDVIAGSNNPYKGEIKAICSKFDNFMYHCQVNNMAELMNQADLCIGAGGTTTWERCAVGLPTILISIAENQELIAEALYKHHVIRYLGTKEQVTESMVVSGLESVLNDSAQLKRMEKLSRELMESKQNNIRLLVEKIGERVNKK
ncbi:UDP-2,4-diacetamido-2,4,6-trideoxy-beta-L-altropyranose hydrolase [Virgibacillus ihumii]|uniref:UDP-2,4-diacetamido-2,4, 6-trideoxy-beta-L-altropyranose hydrolase n=1 Tax=Virgibacillus ihumii TaxID=2686091 RepID=UPI00157DABE5|nr:UDP-2,4-diacetamido-2,4,6-trideoxy-beta-L-altropyranose hydrolase [Virgibacillus ihumii]